MNGGLFLSPSIGVDYSLSGGKSLSFSVNYILKELNSDVDKGKYNHLEYRSRLGATIGFRF